MPTVIPAEVIENKIFLIRGQKVMLDHDLANLYQVPTKALIQAVKRNKERFPKDFMFQLTHQELAHLRSQIVTSKKGRGGRRYLPYAFTEHGALMLANVLKSERAIKTSIMVIRTFIKLRELAATYKTLEHAIKELEHKVGKHDKEIRAIFDAIRQLMSPPQPSKRRIGFHAEP